MSEKKYKYHIHEEWAEDCSKGAYGCMKWLSPVDGHLLTEEEFYAELEKYRKSDAYKEDMERLERGEKI